MPRKRFLPRMVLLLLLAGCAQPPAPKPPMNPVTAFEIPARDLDRAQRFYEAVFQVELIRDSVDGLAMAWFPHTPDGYGTSGALVQGETYEPSLNGTRVYFRVQDMDGILTRAVQQGAVILYPKKDIGELGFVAEFQDSEGNRIALSQPR